MVEDYDMYLRLARAGWRFAYVHRQVARYRWPRPGGGMSSRKREQQLWELAVFASFVLRHPLTPGPRRQVRMRVKRGAPTAARNRLSGPAAPLHSVA